MKGNDAYLEGSFFLTAPLRSTIGDDGSLNGSLWLLEPYVSWGEGGERATSLGMAWRHLFSQQPASAMNGTSRNGGGVFAEGAFVGANLFADVLDTQFDNRFWQAGGGLEFGSRYLEVRTNYYLPLSDPQDVDIWKRESSRERVSKLYEDPRAAGNAIAQEIGYGLYQVSTHIDRHLVGSESGLEGWDAEAALMVPWIDRWMEVRVIPGYYQFQNQPFGPQTAGSGKTEGWKLGVEARPVPALALYATWYEDPAWTGQDWMAGFRAEVPFEIGDCGDGQGFWDRVNDAFRPRRRHLAERLIEPVKRQNTAVRTASQVVEDVASRKVTREVDTLREERRETDVVLGDVVFLNGAGPVGNGIGAGRADGDGSANRPFQNASKAAEEAIERSSRTGRIWTVYAEGSVTGVEGRYDRQRYFLWARGGRGFRLAGSGELIEGAGGLWFGSGVTPMFQEIKVVGSDHFVVGGVMAQKILCDRVQSVWIHDNLIGTEIRDIAGKVFDSPQTGWVTLTPIGAEGALTLQNTRDATVERNQFWQPDRVGFSATGIVVTGFSGYPDFEPGPARVRIRNNVIRAADYGIEVITLRSPGLAEVWITDNLITGAAKAGVSAWDGIPPEFAPTPGTVQINAFRGNVMRDVGQDLITNFRNSASYVRP
jgi:hypothetical protein